MIKIWLLFLWSLNLKLKFYWMRLQNRHLKACYYFCLRKTNQPRTENNLREHGRHDRLFRPSLSLTVRLRLQITNLHGGVTRFHWNINGNGNILTFRISQEPKLMFDHWNPITDVEMWRNKVSGKTQIQTNITNTLLLALLVFLGSSFLSFSIKTLSSYRTVANFSFALKFTLNA